MGKSEKKVKSEKIKALRKQYEAFLEEDKKRRERNEYILGRLAEMRSCTAVVPHSTQSTNILHARQISTLKSPHLPERSTVNLLKHTQYQEPQLDISAKSPEQTVLLEEIVKKYILIPKRDYYNNSRANIDENSDWQSKYEILNHLKNIEKEDMPTRLDRGSKDDGNQNIEDEFLREDYSKALFNNDLPVKDSSAKTDVILENHLHKNHKENVNEFNVDDSRAARYGYGDMSEFSVDYVKSQKDDAVSQASKKVIEHTSEEVLNSGIENLNIIASPIDTLHTQRNYDNYNTINTSFASQELPYEYLTNNNEDEKKPEEENKENDYKSSNIIAAKIETQEKQFNFKRKDSTEIEDNQTEAKKVVFLDKDNYDPVHELVHQDISKENVEHSEPIEMINVSDFTPNAGVKLEDGVNINPQGYYMYEGIASTYNEPQTTTVTHESNLQEITNPVMITQNETNVERTYNYDSGQGEKNTEYGNNEDQGATEPVIVENTVDDTGIEEFEAEQRDMFYQEQADENYHEGAEGYNQENYQQNEYDYYESAQQGAPVEIGEHEETTQLYDQHYDAQYGTTAYQQPQLYEQQHEGYGEQQQVYENQEGFEEQPGYNQQAEYGQQQGYMQQGYEQHQGQEVYELPQLYDPQSSHVGYEQQAEYEQQAYDTQSYDQLQYEQQNNETPQNIEQQLDNEQG